MLTESNTLALSHYYIQLISM